MKLSWLSCKSEQRMLAVSLNVFDSIDNIPLKIARYLIGMQITDLGSGDGCENKIGLHHAKQLLVKN